MTVELYEAALRAMPYSASVYELDSTVVYMNPATERMMGATFAELRGKRLFEVYPDAVGTAFHTAFSAAAAGKGPQTFTHYYRRFDNWFASDVLLEAGRIHVYAREIGEEIRRQRRLDTLGRISAVLADDSLDEAARVRGLADAVSGVLDAQCTLALLTDDRETLEPLVRTSADPAALALLAPLTRWSAHVGHPGEALRTRTAVLDAGESKSLVPIEIRDAPRMRASVVEYNLSSVIAVPLIVDTDPIGVLIVTRRGNAVPLNHHDRTLLVEVAPSIAVYLSNARRREQRARTERGRELVARASAQFNRSLDWKATVAAVAELPVGEMADLCMVDRLLPDGTLERIAIAGRDQPSPTAVPAVLVRVPSHGASRAAIERRGPVVLRDIDETLLRRNALDDRHYEALRSLEARSAVSVPLMYGGEPLGVLSIASRTRNFDEIDVSIVTELAAHAATALENARLFEEAQHARSDAEHANRSKDEFLAMLGHELRNPLAPLVTALDLMHLKHVPQLDRERAILRRQVDHLSRLVDDLLDISRITRGKIELRHDRVVVADIVTKAVEQTSPLFDEKRHHLVVDVPPDLIVEGDPTRLAQITANLLSNAAKYTAPEGRIEIRATRVGTDVEIRVRDNGIGIAPVMLPHVFDLFVQAPQSSERPAGGLGLGLTIVRSLVELHRGRVMVHSDGAGKGSEFTVTLPTLADKTVAADRAASPHITRSATSRRVLVVDDNEDAALMLGELLDAHGHEIRTAFDGPSALRIADEVHPEVAVLDIGLPVMDGYELANRLRAQPTLQDVRLIAVTGYGQESDRAKSREAGFQAHLAKPVSIETLVRLVEHA